MIPSFCNKNPYIDITESNYVSACCSRDQIEFSEHIQRTLFSSIEKEVYGKVVDKLYEIDINRVKISVNIQSDNKYLYGISK